MNVTNFLSFQVHGNSGSGGGIVETLDSFLSFIETLPSKSSADIFTQIMPGLASLDNIHPLVVHFPIALLISFFLVDFIGSVFKKPTAREAASYLLYLGTLSALFAVIAGFIAAQSVQHGGGVPEIMENHKLLGLSVLSLSTFLSAWRLISYKSLKGSANVFYLLLSLVLCFLISFGADLGALMVYKHGVSVDAAKVGMEEAFHEHSH